MTGRKRKEKQKKVGKTKHEQKSITPVGRTSRAWFPMFQVSCTLNHSSIERRDLVNHYNLRLSHTEDSNMLKRNKGEFTPVLSRCSRKPFTKDDDGGKETKDDRKWHFFPAKRNGHNKKKMSIPDGHSRKTTGTKARVVVFFFSLSLSLKFYSRSRHLMTRNKRTSPPPPPSPAATPTSFLANTSEIARGSGVKEKAPITLS